MGTILGEIQRLGIQMEAAEIDEVAAAWDRLLDEVRTICPDNPWTLEDRVAEDDTVCMRCCHDPGVRIFCPHRDRRMRAAASGVRCDRRSRREEPMRHRTTFGLLSALTALLLLAGPTLAAPGALVTFGKSDAERIVLLHAYYPGYWWDHTDLTVAVQAAPNVDPVFVTAIREAIATWSRVLSKQFPTISLTDVTDTVQTPHQADIVVHYVPDAGGVVWGGYAVCGARYCNNVIVRSDVPDLIDVGVPNYDPGRVYRVALHELGHALGLGHAEPLNETNDLMGYGWSVPEPDTTPVLSTCDLKALAVVFEWAVLGASEPYPSSVSSVTC